MSDIDPKLVAEIVKNVMQQLEGRDGKTAAAPVSQSDGVDGVFDDMDAAIVASVKAQQVWAETPKEVKGKVIAALRVKMHEHADEFARRAVEETGMGRIEDKIVKHHNAADGTPGLEDLEVRSWTGDKGLVFEEYAPYGVIAAITPSTHPIPVLLNSIIITIAPGNSVVFNVHPAGKKVSAYALAIFHRAIVENGGPANLISMVKEPTLESVQTLFRHPKTALIAATGGPMLVKAAFDSGKKVIAAGPGNPPVVVDETADLADAAKYIIEGASFDNNILCIAEKEVFVVDSVFDAFMKAMADAGAVLLNDGQIRTLAEKAFSKNEKGQVAISRDFIGKNARVLAQAVGVSLSDDVRLLCGETTFDNLFVQEEQMMPFMPVVRARHFDEALDMAVKAEHGFQHTAMIHSNNLDHITRFTRAIDTSIVVANGSSLAGNGGYAGEGYFSHTIASPTGEGVCTPRDFARVRRLAMYRRLRIA